MNELQFDQRDPALISVQYARHHPERSPAVPAHQTKDGIFVIDPRQPSEIFDWHHAVMRSELRKHKVRHIAIDRRPHGNAMRIVGIPIDCNDNAQYIPVRQGNKIVRAPMCPLDVRMSLNSQDIDPTLPQRHLDIIPDFEAAMIRGRMFIRFAYPDDIEARVAELVLPGLAAV